VWEFKSANLVDKRGRPVKETYKDYKEGVLIVKITSKQSGIEQNATVCKSSFDWNSAKIFCWNIGYRFADWGSYPRNTNYVPRLVS
jgi:hypothetical protein